MAGVCEVGACVAGGHAWWWSVHGRGYAWQGGMHGRRLCVPHMPPPPTDTKGYGQ